MAFCFNLCKKKKGHALSFWYVMIFNFFSNILDSINFGVSMQILISNIPRHIAHIETEEKMY